MIKKILAYLSPFYQFLLNLFFPKKCVNCGKYGCFLCYECVSQIVKIKTLTCPYCGKISQSAYVCSKCKKKNKVYFNSLFIAAQYGSSPVKEIVHNLKYCGLTDLAELCGELIKESLSRANVDKNFVVTYVPMSRNKERKRGFNQSKLIAEYVAESMGLACENLLVKTVDTKHQVGLKKSERFKNITDVFKISNKNLGNYNKILIIDDVVTTGATLNECSKVLRQNGVMNIVAAVVAKNIQHTGSKLTNTQNKL